MPQIKPSDELKTIQWNNHKHGLFNRVYEPNFAFMKIKGSLPVEGETLYNVVRDYLSKNNSTDNVILIRVNSNPDNDRCDIFIKGKDERDIVNDCVADYINEEICSIGRKLSNVHTAIEASIDSTFAVNNDKYKCIMECVANHASLRASNTADKINGLIHSFITTSINKYND